MQNLPISQRAPIHPSLHWQEKEPGLLIQRPPWRHGFIRHSLISVNTEVVSWNPNTVHYFLCTQTVRIDKILPIFSAAWWKRVVIYSYRFGYFENEEYLKQTPPSLLSIKLRIKIFADDTVFFVWPTEVIHQVRIEKLKLYQIFMGSMGKGQ